MMAPALLPRCMRVFERGWVSSNNILFLDPGAATLVDTGYSRHAAQTLALIDQALDGRHLDGIVNTHTHSDHVGGNAELSRRHPRVRVTIPAGEAAVVRAWDEQALHLAPMGQECERFGFDATYADGDTLTLGGLQWRAIASPGHDMESLMLWCASERILISADALWEHGFGVLFPALPPATEIAHVFELQRATLASIAALAPRLVIPGHGAPFADVPAALARAHARLDHFAADPRRNTRNAAKVTLAFLLMIEGRMALDTLAARVAALPMLAQINRTEFGLSAQGFADWLVGELERSAAAHRSDAWLVAGRGA
jgi:glyoxylase-like metal-dependent hydrolase (beta-lactamase superfamily II)